MKKWTGFGGAVRLVLAVAAVIAAAVPVWAGDYPLSTEVFTGPMGWKYRTITSGTYAGRVVLVGHTDSATMTEAIVYANYNLSTTYDDHRRVHALDGTFRNWPNLKTVHISMGVIELNGTFENCENLENVYFHNDGQTWWDNGAATTTIGDNTFRNCKSLKQFILPGPTTTWASSLTTIGYRAFSGCTSLTSIDFTSPYSAPLLQSIGNNAFEGCTGLVEAKIGGDGQQGLALGSQLFYGCSNLERVTLGPAVASVAVSGTTDPSGGMFCGCDKLDTVKLETIRLQSIPNYMFSKSGVRFVELPEATYAGEAYTTVGRGAFNYCQRLEAVYERNVGGKFKPTAVGDKAFDNCRAMTGRVDLARCTSIGDYAFNYCENWVAD